jgi:hypothetical protein
MGLQGRPHRDRALSGYTEEQNARSQEDRSEEHNYRSVGCLTAVLCCVCYGCVLGSGNSEEGLSLLL